MTKKEKLAVLECVSAVAWADGKITIEEIEVLSEITKSIGDIDQITANNLLKTKIDIKDIIGKISYFQKELIGQILTFCWRMCITDNTIHKNELKVMRTIASICWQSEQLDDIISWLKKGYETDELYFKLFVVPEMLDKNSN